LQESAITSPEPADEVGAWAGGLCGALSRWEDAAVRLGSEAQQAIAENPPPSEGKQVLRDLLEPLLLETRRLIEDVGALGAPPVDTGAAIAARLDDGLKRTFGILLKARVTAEALSEKRERFLAGTEEVNRLIQGAVTRIDTTIRDIDADFDEPALAAAFERAPGCTR
jgi:hypothetical protein